MQTTLLPRMPSRLAYGTASWTADQGVYTAPGASVVMRMQAPCAHAVHWQLSVRCSACGHDDKRRPTQRADVVHQHSELQGGRQGQGKAARKAEAQAAAHSCWRICHVIGPYTFVCIVLTACIEQVQPQVVSLTSKGTTDWFTSCSTGHTRQPRRCTPGSSDTTLARAARQPRRSATRETYRIIRQLLTGACRCRAAAEGLGAFGDAPWAPSSWCLHARTLLCDHGVMESADYLITGLHEVYLFPHTSERAASLT